MNTEKLNKCIEELTSVKINDKDASIEIEARFGNFKGRDFISGISSDAFFRIVSLANSAYGTPEHTITKDYHYKSAEKDTIERYTEQSPGFLLIEKRKYKHIDYNDNFIRISLATEKSTEVDKLPDKSISIVREKDRRSYPLNYVKFEGSDSSPKFRLDLTKVKTSKDSEDDEFTYEVEIEMVEPFNKNIPDFCKTLNIALKAVLDTEILYGEREKTNVMFRLNENYLGKQKSKELNQHALTKARNLKITDLVIGGIVPKDKGIFYSVSPKADGIRVLLIIDQNGIYLLTPPGSLNKIFDRDTALRLKSFVGTVIECESIPSKNILRENYKNLRYYLLAYDVLSIARDHRVQDYSRGVRLGYINDLPDIFNNIPNFRLEIKESLQFFNVEEFYNDVTETFNNLDNNPYKTDGLIFTPESYQYQTNLRVDRNLSKRRLDNTADIVKWKPLDKLTIDFMIEYNETLNTYLLSSSSGVKKFTLFEGDDHNPFDPSVQLDIDSVKNFNMPNGTVIEFAWRSDKMVAIRIRHDKQYPNSILVANDVWLDIFRPISKNLLTGKEYGLSFRYHNRIKAILYNSVFQTFKEQETRTLLDIGSGKGGDVYKWEKYFTRVVCVEPNEENRIELERRLDNSKLKGNYLIIAENGQNHVKISNEVEKFIQGGKVDCISYMLSLSFFFDTNESFGTIRELAFKMLKEGGVMVGLTIDGELVKEYFSDKPIINGKKSGNFNLITFDNLINDGLWNKIYVNIPDSIVIDQTEYLVYINSMDVLLKDFMVKDFVGVTDEEELMIGEEKIYSRMFKFFRYSRFGKK